MCVNLKPFQKCLKFKAYVQIVRVCQLETASTMSKIYCVCSNCYVCQLETISIMSKNLKRMFKLLCVST